MSVRAKVFDGFMRVGREHGSQAKITMKKSGMEVIPVILKYHEGGIKSGIMVAVRPDDYDLVKTALSKLMKVENGQEVVDRIVGEGVIEVVSPGGIIVPGGVMRS